MERRVEDMNMEKTALCVGERLVRKREKRNPKSFFLKSKSHSECKRIGLLKQDVVMIRIKFKVWNFSQYNKLEGLQEKE